MTTEKVCETCGRKFDFYNMAWWHICPGIDMREIDSKPLTEKMKFAAEHAVPDWLKKWA